MKNAYLRMGMLQLTQFVGNKSTNIRVRVDRYMGEKEQAHVLSVFGGDTEIGAVAAAITEHRDFTLHLPDGSSHRINLGEHPSCYRGTISVPGRKHPLRHLIAISEAIQGNGSAGKTYMLNFHPDLAWNTLVSLLGIPAAPEWGKWVLNRLEQKKRVVEIEGIGCEPVRIRATRRQILRWIEHGVRAGLLPFPEKDGPLLWPRYTMRTALAPIESVEVREDAETVESAREPPHGGKPLVDAGGGQPACFQAHPKPHHDDAAEGQSGLRTVPGNELVDGELVCAAGRGGAEAIENGRLKLVRCIAEVLLDQTLPPFVPPGPFLPPER